MSVEATSLLQTYLPEVKLDSAPLLKGLESKKSIAQQVRGIQLGDHEKLRDSFALRYLVYCVDRGFLPPEDYPHQLEADPFDEHSMHFGAVNEEDNMVGTVRLVQWSEEGLPLDAYWSDILPSHMAPDCAEISRLAVPRQVGRNAAGYVVPAEDQQQLESFKDDSRFSFAVTMELYIALYQAAKTAGVKFLVAAMEKSLARLLSRYHFPFVEIGEEVDYYGKVTPYILDIAAFDRRLIEKAPKLYKKFQHGLKTPVPVSLAC